MFELQQSMKFFQCVAPDMVVGIGAVRAIVFGHHQVLDIHLPTQEYEWGPIHTARGDQDRGILMVPVTYMAILTSQLEDTTIQTETEVGDIFTLKKIFLKEFLYIVLTNLQEGMAL